MADLSDMFGNLSLRKQKLVPSEYMSQVDEENDVDSTDNGDGALRYMGTAAGPVNTVLLYCKTHGESMPDDQLSQEDKEMTTIWAPPADFCPFYEESTFTLNAKLRDLRSPPSNDVNGKIRKLQEYTKPRMAEAKRQAPRLIAESASFLGSANTPAEKGHVYNSASLTYTPRKPISNHSYTYHTNPDPKRGVHNCGIFLLGTTFSIPELMTPVDLQGGGVFPPFSVPGLYDPRQAMEHQRLNLLNIPVLHELSRRVLGVERELPFHPRQVISNSETGIEHYEESLLSQHIAFWKEMGAEKVIVYDDTCRVSSFKPHVNQEEVESAAHIDPQGQRRTLTPFEMRKPKDGTERVSDGGTRIKKIQKKTRRRKSHRRKTRVR